MAGSAAPTGDPLSMTRMVPERACAEHFNPPFTNTRARRVSEVLRVSTAAETQCGDVLAPGGRGDSSNARAHARPDEAQVENVEAQRPVLHAHDVAESQMGFVTTF